LTALSNTQVDRLGDRLRKGGYGEADVRQLDEYRRSFDDAYQNVVHTLRDVGFEPTGRPSKSTASIVEKLRRESIRLSQMQDIAGCRIVVANMLEQDRSVTSLRAAFPEAIVVDRRQNPSHGYRAVHVIPQPLGKPIEIQVRSSLQHVWAELSEKASDVVDPMVKYGGGPAEMRTVLDGFSQSVTQLEWLEGEYAEMGGRIELIERDLAESTLRHGVVEQSDKKRKRLDELKQSVGQSRTEWETLQASLTDALCQAITWLDRKHQAGEKS